MPTRTDLHILPESSDADEGDAAARCPLCHPYLSMLNIANCKAILQASGVNMTIWSLAAQDCTQNMRYSFFKWFFFQSCILVLSKLQNWFYFLIDHSSHIASGLSSRDMWPHPRVSAHWTVDTDTDTGHSSEVVSK